MRVLALAAFIAASLAAPAQAATIVQGVSGTYGPHGANPATLSLFDPTLGTLNSVTIEATTYVIQSTVRPSSDSDLLDLTIPVSATVSALSVSALLSGTEDYAAGHLIGGWSVSGSLSAVLTGAATGSFVGSGSSLEQTVWQYVDPPVTYGQVIEFPYGGLNGSVIYNYTAVPEPATWALMLFGFAGIGAALRAKRHSAPAPSHLE